MDIQPGGGMEPSTSSTTSTAMDWIETSVTKTGLNCRRRSSRSSRLPMADIHSVCTTITSEASRDTEKTRSTTSCDTRSPALKTSQKATPTATIGTVTHSGGSGESNRSLANSHRKYGNEMENTLISGMNGDIALLSSGPDTTR